MTDPRPLYIVRFGHQITRRKYIHHVRSPDGQYLYITSRADQLWQWLIEEGCERFVLQLDDTAREITIGPQVVL